MQRLTGKELVTVLISIAILIVSLTSVGQRAVRQAAKPLSNVLVGSPATQNPNSFGDQNGNVVRFTSEPFQRHLLVRNDNEHLSEENYALHDDVLVGVVFDAKRPLATLQLLTDPQFKAVVRTNQNAQGVLEGELNALLLTKVPQNQTLEPGDEVFTSGLDGRFANNIPIGVVLEVFNDQDLLKSAYVRPYADLNNLTDVSFNNE